MKRRFVRNNGGFRNRFSVHYHLMVAGRKVNMKFCRSYFLEILGIMTEDNQDSTSWATLNKKIPNAFTADLKKVSRAEAEKYNYFIECHGRNMDILRNDRDGCEDYTCFYAMTKLAIKRLWKLPKRTKDAEYYVFQVEYE